MLILHLWQRISHVPRKSMIVMLMLHLTIHFIFHQNPLSILFHRVVGPQIQSLLSLISNLWQWKVSILPSEYKLHLSLLYMESQINQIVKLILHLWHSKLHLSILINRMTSPQNCSYRKPTTVMLTLHLWQTTVMLLWQLFFLRLSYRSWDERC